MNHRVFYRLLECFDATGPGHHDTQRAHNKHYLQCTRMTIDREWLIDWLTTGVPQQSAHCLAWEAEPCQVGGTFALITNDWPPWSSVTDQWRHDAHTAASMCARAVLDCKHRRLQLIEQFDHWTRSDHFDPLCAFHWLTDQMTIAWWAAHL